MNKTSFVLIVALQFVLTARAMPPVRSAVALGSHGQYCEMYTPGI